jgi:hypothetical protein
LELAQGAGLERFAGLDAVEIGRTIPEPRLRVASIEGALLDVSLEELQAAWRRPMRDVFH